MIYVFLFLIGLAVGSFLNVVIYREVNEIQAEQEAGSLWGKLKSWLPQWAVDRSFCDHCKKPLAWHENIPVLSYLLQAGKCKTCHKPITPQYPFIELLTALEFVWLYWLLSQFSFFGQVEGFYSFALTGYWFFIFSVSLVLALIDLKTQILPDIIVLPAIGVSLLRLFFTGQWQFLLAAGLTSLFLLSLYLVTRGRGIGFGDVKLGLFIGLVLGWWQRIVVAVFLAFLTGAIVGVIMIIAKKKTIKSAIPFGPFLLLGMGIGKLIGDQLWGWYWGMIK